MLSCYCFLPLLSTVTKKQQTWKFSEGLGLNSNARAICIHRWKIWWSIPRLLKKKPPVSGFYSSRGDVSDVSATMDGLETGVPPETCLFLSQFEDGNFLLLFPVVDENMGFTLEGSDSFPKSTSEFNDSSCDGHLILHGHDVSEEEETRDSSLVAGGDSSIGVPLNLNSRKALLVSSGPDPYYLMSWSLTEVKRHLREGLNSPQKCGDENNPQEEVDFDCRDDPRDKINVHSLTNSTACDDNTQTLYASSATHRLGDGGDIRFRNSRGSGGRYSILQYLLCMQYDVNTSTANTSQITLNTTFLYIYCIVLVFYSIIL